MGFGQYIAVPQQCILSSEVHAAMYMRAPWKERNPATTASPGTKQTVGEGQLLVKPSLKGFDGYAYATVGADKALIRTVAHPHAAHVKPSFAERVALARRQASVVAPETDDHTPLGQKSSTRHAK